MNKKLFRGLITVAAFLLCVVLTASVVMYQFADVINRDLGINVSVFVPKEGVDAAELPIRFASDYAKDINNPTDEELKAKNDAVAAFVETEMEEGAVLLYNNNNTLPLAKGSKVTLFGKASQSPYTKGSSGGGSGGTKVTYLDALQDTSKAGFVINQALIDAYKADKNKRSAGDHTLGEADPSVYTDEIKATFKDYSDVAIIMLAREGAESNDLLQKDAEGISQLALHDVEKQMLNIVKEYKDNGTFKKIVLLINSAYPMEVKWAKDYGIDACMVIGGPGNSTGFRGVSDLLVGNVNPSGKLVDTWASNSLSAPASINQGEFAYTNKKEVADGMTDNAPEGQFYVVQAEGIYVGYKYYETRYEDCILNQGGAASSAGIFDSKGGVWNYAEEMSYPFGYGISYTTFEQTMDSVKDNGDGTITVKGTVKNTGKVAGKSVVELYAQTPYGDYEKKYNVEKASVNLVDFYKTAVLEPGKSESYEMTFEKYLLASYDYTNQKGYILSAGDYYLAIGDDAHDALNNILAKKGATGMFDIDGKPVSGNASKVYTWNQKDIDTTSYEKSETGRVVTNQLDEMDINYWIPNAVTYLTRKDWAGTFPKSATVLTATPEMIERICDGGYKQDPNGKSALDVITGVDKGIMLADMWGVAYDDPLWDEFINQFTVKELTSIFCESGGIVSIEAHGCPKMKNGDGPDGIAGNAYVNESLAAASWNKEQMRKRGDFLAEDSLFKKGPQQSWCPGGDTHRTPFGGRNFEYYSEDGNLAWYYEGIQCGAMEAKGVSAGPKHFFANDQETRRIATATFGNEQEFREIMLRAFEGAFTKGGATSVMTCFNRVGLDWVGHSVAIQDNILRGEWGFVGIVITDASGANSYMHTIDALMNGTNLFCLTSGSAATNRVKEMNAQVRELDDGDFLQKMKDVAKEIYYTYAHTNIMNGLSSDVEVKTITPWWKPTIVAIDVVVGVAFLAMVALYVVALKKED